MPIKTDELKGENCQFPLMIDITGIYTVKETAGILKMSPRNVQRWIDEGKTCRRLSMKPGEKVNLFYNLALSLSFLRRSIPC